MTKYSVRILGILDDEGNKANEGNKTEWIEEDLKDLLTEYTFSGQWYPKSLVVKVKEIEERDLEYDKRIQEWYK